MVNLIDLPSSIKQHIISYLPQQSVLNLAQTNFEFYQPCIQKLYKRILIQRDPIVNSPSDQRLSDYVDSNHTVVYALHHKINEGKVFDKSEVQMKLINLRLQLLIESLKFNSSLLEHVEEIHIIGKDFEKDLVFVDNLKQLVELVSTNNLSLRTFFISDINLRSKIDLAAINVKTRVLDDTFDDQIHFIHGKSIEELIITDSCVISSPVLYIPGWLFKLKSLILPNDEPNYWKFVHQVIHNHPTVLSNLKTFKLVINHEELSQNIELVKLINWAKLENLEIVIGSPNEQEDVLAILKLIPVNDCQKLKKLSIVQNFVYSSHKSNEIFDLNIFNFIRGLVKNLQYLSIEHSVPLFGDFDDGFDGNYLRRMKLYETILPQILSTATRKVTLYLPNLFASLSSYEQSMNTMLWNGCKCTHCIESLGLVDDYLMHHKYYDVRLQRFKDLNSSHFFNIVANYLSLRLISRNEYFTNLHLGHFPLRQYSWDYHSLDRLDFYHPLKCYSVKVIDLGEFDGEDDNKEKENFRCNINSFHYLKGVPLSMSHYFDSIIIKVLKLDRGNAEKRFDEDQKDEMIINETQRQSNNMEAYVFNDGGDNESTHLNINRVVINGIIYTMDKELNGTHCYERYL
ncbi:uncharacterized protein RJT21DRAFT_114240 [Scheffersomyces amazonensis]|uniref:uncharacterized protein n=1 Tax=Scheffersomyces amazonensis TaxID=1078765 RepID=UPI00315CEE38